MRSLAIGASAMRTNADTAPPRCAMPCTSGCLRWKPASTAAWSITHAIDSTPWPPTPHSTRSKFMAPWAGPGVARASISLMVFA